MNRVARTTGSKTALKKRAIPGDAVDLGGDADELALRVEFDVAAVAAVDRAVDVEDRRNQAALINALGVPEDVALGLVDQAGPQQGERLRGAVADPGAVVVARARLEGEAGGVDQDERDLRFERVADLPVADDDPARAELFPPGAANAVAQRRRTRRRRAAATSSRIGAETTTDALSPG